MHSSGSLSLESRKRALEAILCLPFLPYQLDAVSTSACESSSLPRHRPRQRTKECQSRGRRSPFDCGRRTLPIDFFSRFCPPLIYYFSVAFALARIPSIYQPTNIVRDDVYGPPLPLTGPPAGSLWVRRSPVQSRTVRVLTRERSFRGSAPSPSSRRGFDRTSSRRDAVSVRIRVKTSVSVGVAQVFQDRRLVQCCAALPVPA